MTPNNHHENYFNYDPYTDYSECIDPLSDYEQAADEVRHSELIKTLETIQLEDEILSNVAPVCTQPCINSTPCKSKPTTSITAPTCKKSPTDPKGNCNTK